MTAIESGVRGRGWKEWTLPLEAVRNDEAGCSVADESG